jgi:membrane protease subunit HflK
VSESPNNVTLHPPQQGWKLPRWLLPAAVAAAVLSWLCSGVYTVAADERGVVVRFGKLHEPRVAPGIHYCLPWPIDRVYTPRTTDVKRMSVGFAMEGEQASLLVPDRPEMLTGDENILVVTVVVQYRIREPAEFLFDAVEPWWLVRRAAESALCDAVASRGVDDVLTVAKGAIQNETLLRTQGLLDSYGTGIEVLAANLQTVDPPPDVNAAFKDVTNAKKDSERLVDQAQAVRESVIPAARGEAQQVIRNAEARATELMNRAHGQAAKFTEVLAEYKQAPDVTRRRIFLEYMENILPNVDMFIVGGATDRHSRITIVEDQP